MGIEEGRTIDVTAPRMCLGRGYGFLPISLGILTAATFVATYVIALVRGDVVPFLPYISDTGAKPPESCIFGQFLCLAAFLALATIYVRYKMVQEFCSYTHPRLCVANKVALGIGSVSALGMTMVACFQETTALVVHLIGASLIFLAGCVYIMLQVFISYNMSPDYCGLAVCRWRLCIAIVNVISLLSTIIGYSISMKEFKGAGKRLDWFHWKPEDPGFVPHVIGSISEWIMALSFLLFFFTYIRDFQKIGVEVHTRLYVTHLDQTPQDVPND